MGLAEMEVRFWVGREGEALMFFRGYKPWDQGRATRHTIIVRFFLKDSGTCTDDKFRVAGHSEVGQTNQYKRVYQELSLELEGF